MRDLTIGKCLNGFTVKIGCKMLVFQKKRKLLKELSRYIDDPKAVEKEYLDKFGTGDINIYQDILWRPVEGNFGCYIAPIKVEETSGVDPDQEEDE